MAVGKATGNQRDDCSFYWVFQVKVSKIGEVSEPGLNKIKKKIKNPALRCVKVNLIDAAAGFTLITLPCNWWLSASNYQWLRPASIVLALIPPGTRETGLASRC